LIVGLLPLLTPVNTSTASPGIAHSVALSTDYVPTSHMLPELERLITAFYSSLFPSPHAPASYRIWLEQIHDTYDSTSACGIDLSHKFPVFPLATPTRTSLVSFEPLLPPCLPPIRRSSSSFSSTALSLPRVSTGKFRAAHAQWYSVGGSLDLSS
jgi:hypothetical protein